jgi:tetratricopeptide (TPR) repeat protein
VDRVLERWLTRAERDHAAGRTASALATWWRATERAPHDPRAPLRLAALLLPASLAAADDDATRMTAERLRDALETAAAVPALDPATQRTLLLRAAFALAVAGDEAGSAAMLRALAGSAVRRGRLAAAEGALDAALRCAGPGDALHAERGAVRLARGRTAEAIDDFREVVRLRPGDPAALRDLAGSLLAAGRSRDALTLYEGLAARAPEDASARLDVARAALQGRALPRAVAAARDAMRLAPRDAEPALVLAAAHLAARDRSAAHAAYEEAQQRNPNDRRAREGLRALAPERDERGAQAPLAAPPSDAGP